MTKGDIVIEWGWDDGYLGRRPSHTLTIPAEDLEGLNEAQRERVIDEYVRDAMDSRVHPWWRIKDGAQ